MVNGLYPDQGVQSVLIWKQTVCKGYQQTTKVAADKKRLRNLGNSENKSD